MAKADITLRGRAYAIACAAGQETRIEALSLELDERVEQIAHAVGDIGEERLLLIAALALLDELDAARKGVFAPPDETERAAKALDHASARLEALAQKLEDGL